MVHDCVPLEDHKSVEISRSSFARSSEISFAKYQTWDDIENWLNNKVKHYKNTVVKVIGRTFEGRNLYAVEMGNPENPKIIIDCGIHAREWISPKMCQYIIHKLNSNDNDNLTKNVQWPADRNYFVNNR